jgi:hypothetical protein
LRDICKALRYSNQYLLQDFPYYQRNIGGV